MTGMIVALFTTAIPVTGYRFFLMLPLCLSVAIIYKTTRCSTLRAVVPAALILWITIVLGMLGIGFGLWALFRVLV